jgi:hypothetical protein
MHAVFPHAATEINPRSKGRVHICSPIAALKAAAISAEYLAATGAVLRTG